jgi:transcription elongation factor GreA
MAPAAGRGQARAMTQHDRTEAGDTSPMLTTEEHADRVRDLQRLRERRERSLAERLRGARAYVSADAEEEVAQIRAEQAVMDRRIAVLERVLAEAVVVEAPADAGVVALGSHVEVRYARTGARAAYRIVGAAGRSDGASVSARSPIGAALLGRRAGDVVEAALPGGRRERLEVLEVGAVPVS